MSRRLALLCLLPLVACATGTPDGLPPPEDEVSVPYNPYRYEMAELERAATAQCEAKGYPVALPLSDQPNRESVRWSYLTFGCYSR